MQAVISVPQSPRAAFSFLAILLIAAWPTENRATPAESCPVYVLERDSTGFTVRVEVIDDSQSSALVFGASSRLVSVIVPESPGTAGNIVQAARPHAVLVRCRVGSIETTVQPAAENRRPKPAVPVAALRGYRLRVNVTGADKSRAVFIIDPDGAISRDTLGPVMDMFRGMVPLGAGDVCCDTRTSCESKSTAVARASSWAGPPVNGRISRIGNSILRNYAVHVGPLPVLANLGAGDGIGLLGQDLWNHFSALEVDWQRLVVRFFR